MSAGLFTSMQQLRQWKQAKVNEWNMCESTMSIILIISCCFSANSFIEEKASLPILIVEDGGRPNLT